MAGYAPRCQVSNLLTISIELLAFVEHVAGLTTEEEYGEDGMASEDAIATVNSLIHAARKLAAKARGGK